MQIFRILRADITKLNAECLPITKELTAQTEVALQKSALYLIIKHMLKLLG